MEIHPAVEGQDEERNRAGATCSYADEEDRTGPASSRIYLTLDFSVSATRSFPPRPPQDPTTHWPATGHISITQPPRQHSLQQSNNGSRNTTSPCHKHSSTGTAAIGIARRRGTGPSTHLRKKKVPVLRRLLARRCFRLARLRLDQGTTISFPRRNTLAIFPCCWSRCTVRRYGLIFADRVVWHDAKFFAAAISLQVGPRFYFDYLARTVETTGPCVSLMTYRNTS
jgi:hypothetical protein